MTDKEEAKLRSDYARLHEALRTITKYMTPEQLQRQSQKRYGLEYEEALEYVYDNIQVNAKNALKNVRRPKV